MVVKLATRLSDSPAGVGGHPPCDAGVDNQHPRLRVGIDRRAAARGKYTMRRALGELRGTSMRRPPRVKYIVLGRVNRTSDGRPTGGSVGLQPFLLRNVFCSAIDTADHRPGTR